jgi:hypothetical protein
MELEQTGFINGNRNLLYPKIPFFLSSRAYRDPTVPITQYNGLCHVTDIASSLGRPVYTGLKKMKGLAPHPWAVTQPTGQSLQWMRVGGGWGGGTPPPSPKGTSNLQPVLRHASEVSAQNWLTGALLCVSVTNILAEELEPLWLAALLLRVQEAFGRYISLHSARSACD